MKINKFLTFYQNPNIEVITRVEKAPYRRAIFLDKFLDKFYLLVCTANNFFFNNFSLNSFTSLHAASAWEYFM